MKHNGTQGFPSHEDADMIPEGINYMHTSESQNEQGESAETEMHKLPYMSDNAQDIDNSRRSRGSSI